MPIGYDNSAQMVKQATPYEEARNTADALLEQLQKEVMELELRLERVLIPPPNNKESASVPVPHQPEFHSEAVAFLTSVSAKAEGAIHQLSAIRNRLEI